MIWLFVAFIVMPILEIWILTQVAAQTGWPMAIVLVIGISAAGAWLVKREGLGVIRRVQASLGSGRTPANDLADGAMIFFASALMLTPGFITDAVGLALLIPPIRAIIRPPVLRYFRKRVEVRMSGAAGRAGFGGFSGFGNVGGFGEFGQPNQREQNPFDQRPGFGSSRRGPGGDDDVIDVELSDPDDNAGDSDGGQK